MSTQGKIKTLFSDKEKTEALFPRTKINAVSDENGKRLNAILDEMVYVGDITEDVTSTPVNADLLGGRPADEYATQNYVANEIAKAQLEGEDVDLSGYATKDEMNTAIRAIDFPVDSVNGRTGAVSLSAQDVGARPSTWLPTIAEIGAAPSGFGLGESSGALCTDANLATKPGFYCMSGNDALNTPSFMENSKYGVLLVETRWDVIHQTLKRGNQIAMRWGDVDGNWNEWKDCSSSAFAPAGYGLGGMGADCITFNGTIKNGFYSMAGDECVDRPEEYPLFRFGFMFVKNRWDGLITQELFHKGISAVRHSIDGGATWEPLEFDNPPMVPGVEYRTTERWAGMAVFTKLVDCGFMPNSAVKNIEIGVAASSIIDYRLMITSDDGTLTSIAPYQNTNLENNLRCVLFNNGINILTNADLSNFSGLCVVKYYKA